MTKNLGILDRFLRLLGTAGLALGAGAAPLPLVARVALGASGLYLLGTVFFGACLGYRVLGLSTCALAPADRT